MDTHTHHEALVCTAGVEIGEDSVGSECGGIGGVAHRTDLNGDGGAGAHVELQHSAVHRDGSHIELWQSGNLGIGIGAVG